MYSVDIDTGGTMTDGLVSGEGIVTALKVETTPHDVTIAFVDILEAAREALGFADLRSLLTEVEVIRWSSTITSNVLAQRAGPKLGLLVTAGHEHDLYDHPALARGRPYEGFEAEWSRRRPPEEILEFFGSWPDGAVVNPLIRM